MTPKEKAKQLVDRFESYAHTEFNERDGYDKNLLRLNAAECAWIAVVEIIEALDAFGYTRTMYDDFETGQCITSNDVDPCEYWKKVQSEIKLL